MYPSLPKPCNLTPFTPPYHPNQDGRALPQFCRHNILNQDVDGVWLKPKDHHKMLPSSRTVERFSPFSTCRIFLASVVSRGSSIASFLQVADIGTPIRVCLQFRGD